MKKIVIVILVLAGSFFAGDSAKAQQLKIGVFDLDIMVQAMPGYRAVDSMVQIFQRDSLAAEYNVFQTEYHRLDSTFKADSAAKKSKALLDYTSNQRQQMALNLVYWQQYEQRRVQDKTGQLAQPLYIQVVNAYKKVLDQKKYNLILKPNTYEMGTPVENVFAAVAKELKIQLPAELGGGQEEAQSGGGATPPSTKPSNGAKPPVKKP
ncbi:MAG: OmpH family outer membrane protein [Chitinophagaceae bacterium]|nr:OmpH family outer membrane protein [Chitinophagaceae bacterium]